MIFHVFMLISKRPKYPSVLELLSRQRTFTTSCCNISHFKHRAAWFMLLFLSSVPQAVLVELLQFLSFLFQVEFNKFHELWKWTAPRGACFSTGRTGGPSTCLHYTSLCNNCNVFGKWTLLQMNPSQEADDQWTTRFVVLQEEFTEGKKHCSDPNTDSELQQTVSKPNLHNRLTDLTTGNALQLVHQHMTVT